MSHREKDTQEKKNSYRPRSRGNSKMDLASRFSFSTLLVGCKTPASMRDCRRRFCHLAAPKPFSFFGALINTLSISTTVVRLVIAGVLVFPG